LSSTIRRVGSWIDLPEHTALGPWDQYQFRVERNQPRDQPHPPIPGPARPFAPDKKTWDSKRSQDDGAALMVPRSGLCQAGEARPRLPRDPIVVRWAKHKHPETVHRPGNG